MTISDEHHLLKADLEGAARALGVTITSEQYMDEHRSLVRVVCVQLAKPTDVRARFVRESFVRRAEKLFVNEVEVGSAWFDDLIFVITSTREPTARFLAAKRVQQALILLVDDDRHVQVEECELRLIDNDTRDDGRDARAELLALAMHLGSGSDAPAP